MQRPEHKQLFIVSAVPREPGREKITFLVKADDHRDAWAVSREATRTGRGAFIRDTHDGDMLHALPLDRHEYTVKKVLSVNRARRGRPPKVTTDDLYDLARKRGVRVPRKIREIIRDELQD